MNFPSRIQYNEAIMGARVRLRVSDHELKEGQVEEVTNGPMRSPWGIEGGFAVVYKYRTKSGKLRALRCFKIQMPNDIKERYELLAAYFRTHVPQITADFRYLDPGIAVRLSPEKFQTFPLIDMEWVDGMTLLERIDHLCQQPDRAALEDLFKRWEALVQLLRQARIAHGDLAGNNIIVRPDGRLVLVDYDGAFIPDFSGRSIVVEGQPDYQHPRAEQRSFDDQMDAFSIQVISTALLALRASPELWGAYTDRADGRLRNENLLFQRSDFVDPERSPLFRHLGQVGDPTVRKAAQQLSNACREAAPRSAQNGEAQAAILQQFRKAAYQKNARAMVSAAASGLLEQHAEFLPSERLLLEETRQFVAMHDKLLKAITANDKQSIIHAYDSKLANKFGDISKPDWQLIKQALQEQMLPPPQIKQQALQEQKLPWRLWRWEVQDPVVLREQTDLEQARRQAARRRLVVMISIAAVALILLLVMLFFSVGG